MTKPTRDECIRAAAPHLAALVLEARAQERAQSKDGLLSPPSASDHAPPAQESAA